MAHRVAIIGCGYVGTAFAEHLIGRGCDVLGTTTTPARAEELSARGIRPLVCRLDETNRLHAALLDRTAVFLLVAPNSQQASYHEVYLEGARHLLTALRGTQVRRFVYTSSTSVYGQDDGEWVTEDATTEPRGESGRVLLATERTLLESGNPAVATTVLRVAGIVGPGRGPLNRLRTSAGATRDDGNAWVNLVHVEDIVGACARLLEVPFTGVLNLACDHPVLRREYYDRLMDDAGLPRMRWQGGDGPPRGKRISNARLKEILGLALRHPSL